MLGLCAPGPSGCVAPVMRGPAAPPSRHRFVGAHGVPNAYGDGVCVLRAPHTHSYPPTPAAAFADTADGARDTRPRYSYFGPHAHHGRSCFRSAWHMHLEPPLVDLKVLRGLGAYSEMGEDPLVPFAGRHPPRPCDAVVCVFDKPHGHRPCPRSSTTDRSEQDAE